MQTLTGTLHVPPLPSVDNLAYYRRNERCHEPLAISLYLMNNPRVTTPIIPR